MSLLDLVEEKFGAKEQGSLSTLSTLGSLKDLKDLKEPLSNRQKTANSVVDLARELRNGNRVELQTLAGDDWSEIAADVPQLIAFSCLAATEQIRASGCIPDSYTNTTTCRNCGDVPIFEGCPPEVIGCPWCFAEGPPSVPGQEQ